MPKKSVTVESVGQVALYKRRGARHIKLSITHAGEIRVSLPVWAPYQAGVDFVRSKSDWINRVRKPKSLLTDHQPIGKQHTLRFLASTGQTVRTRLAGTTIIVSLPPGVTADAPQVQRAAEAAVIRALKREAEDMLPVRLRTIAQLHGFDFRSVSVKKLKGRWGSCTDKKDIVLNCYLMLLPWELIDYVLVHELVHTRIMAHGKPFWDEVGRYVDNLAAKRKAIRAHRPGP